MLDFMNSKFPLSSTELIPKLQRQKKNQCVQYVRQYSSEPNFVYIVRNLKIVGGRGGGDILVFLRFYIWFQRKVNRVGQ